MNEPKPRSTSGATSTPAMNQDGSGPAPAGTSQGNQQRGHQGGPSFVSSARIDDGIPVQVATGTGTPPIQPVTIVEPVPENASVTTRFVARSGSLMRMLMPTTIVAACVLLALATGKTILMPIFISTLLALLMSPLVGVMKRWLRLPEALGALLIVVTLVGGVGWVTALIYPPAQSWIANSDRDLAKVRDRLAFLRKPIDAIRSATDAVDRLANDPTGETSTQTRNVRPSTPAPRAASPGTPLSGFVTVIEPLLVGGLTMIVLLYFLLASGDMFLRKLVRVLPTLHDKRKGVDIARGIQDELARYLRAIGMVNLGLGAVVGSLCYYAGLPNALLWGCMVAVLNFVPYVGPMCSLLVLSFISIVTVPGIADAFIVPVGFAIITLIEGNFVQPLFVGKRLQLNPVVIFLSIAFWGWLWGIGGIILAVPILVVIKICCENIPSWRALGEFLSDESESVAPKVEPHGASTTTER